tara:strand:- start:260 stop:757 length:498 start_codon:yes stop_codon:yes gene_type:complete
MARITVNTSGTFPHVYLSEDLTAVPAGDPLATAGKLDVTCLQDITISNSTGIFSWTDFCSASINKLTTPSDNEISTNMVIDSVKFFGDSASTGAALAGVDGISRTRTKVQFMVVMNGDDTTSGAQYYKGEGYITNIAPAVSPDSPVWVSPMTIAVTGSYEVNTIT